MSQELFNVRDQVIVVTGGLGQLGWQFSSCLLEQQARVAIFDSREGSEAAERAVSDRGNPRLMIIPTDVTRRDSIAAGLEEVTRRWGTPQGLVNAAALDSPPDASATENGPFEAYPETSWDLVMEVNVKGVFLCCQVVGGAMAAAGRGSIVNVSSIYGLVSPDQRIYDYRRQDGALFFKPAVYSTSKSALLNLTRYLATYWAPRNVRVNTITFGGVFNHQNPQFLEAYATHVPLGRMAREDEYNGAIVFLLSDASSYMTGSNLVIDGGWTAW